MPLSFPEPIPPDDPRYVEPYVWDGRDPSATRPATEPTTIHEARQAWLATLPLESREKAGRVFDSVADACIRIYEPMIRNLRGQLSAAREIQAVDERPYVDRYVTAITEIDWLREELLDRGGHAAVERIRRRVNYSTPELEALMLRYEEELLKLGRWSG